MEPEAVETLLQHHLESNGLWNGDSKLWSIGRSSLGGRGMFATKDISPGEIIFVDVALVIGPRAYTKHLPMCVNCYKTGCPLFPCDRGCGLPVCSTKCEISPGHETECTYLREWKPTCGSMWSMDLLRTVVPIRALSLSKEQRRLVYTLECHQGSQHGTEVDLLKSNTEIPMTADQEAFLRKVCTVLDTNSFESAVLVDGSLTSLRGLYPMGSLQNHCCVPNTRHYIDSQQRLNACAALPIRKGEEITMTYTCIYWDTMLRRRHLFETKHFLCACKRCADPEEHRSLLAALKCANEKCTGNLLPKNPLNMASPWICDACGVNVSSRQIASIQSALASITKEVVQKSPRQILRFIKSQLPELIPPTNHIMVDMKFMITSYFGRIENCLWEDLSDAEVEVKKHYCTELISLSDTLGCGNCKKKGLLAYELYCTNKEKLRRLTHCVNHSNATLEITSEYNENIHLLKKAAEILENDITAPESLYKDLDILRKSGRQTE